MTLRARVPRVLRRRMRWVWAAILLFPLVSGRCQPLGVTPPSSAPSTTAPADALVVHVTDADSISVRLSERVDRVRLVGLDAPESTRGKSECYGQEATAFTTEQTLGKTVRLEGGWEERDRYGRLLRFVHADRTNVNLALVEGGYARVMFCRRSACWRSGDGTVPPAWAMAIPHSQELLAAEVRARTEGGGQWGACPR